MRAFPVAMGCSILLLTYGFDVLGQTSTRSSDEMAAEHYDDGLDAARAGAWGAARASFDAAWRLKKHYQIAINLGRAEHRLGRYREAAEHLSYFLREAPDAAGPDGRLAAEMLADARTHVAALTIEVTEDGAEVLVDGEVVGTSPMQGEIYVEPGTRVVEARKQGFRRATARLAVAAGGAQRASLRLSGAEERPGDGAQSAGSVEPWSPTGAADARDAAWPAWPIAVGVGLAASGLAAGVGFTLAANDRSQEAEQRLTALRARTPAPLPVCGVYGTRCAGIERLRREQDTLQDLAVAGYVVSGVAALGTLGLIVWQSSSPRGSTASARMTPVLGSGLGGVVLDVSLR